MDTQTMDNVGNKPLLDLIKELGGWHLLPGITGKRDDWNLQKLIQDVQNKFNSVGLFSWQVTEDYQNSSRYVIVLDQVELDSPLSVSDYLNITANKNLFNDFLDLMTHICTKLGANKSEARVEMSKVIELETALANITMSFEERRDKNRLYNPYTIGEWQKENTFLNWSMYFNSAFKLVNRTVSDTEKIIVNTPNYFKKLDKLVKNYSKTEEGQRTLTSFILWRVSYFSSNYLAPSFHNEAAIWKTQFGIRNAKMTWDHCVTDTLRNFGSALGAMYVREVFQDETRIETEKMADNIRNAFKRNLVNLNWMDVETREAVKLKADAINIMVGHPDYILNKNKLDEQYAGLKIKPNEYFKNNLAFNLFSLKNNLNMLDKPVDKTKWANAPSDVGAYYSPTKNRMVVPAGILQPPLFSTGNLNSVNYGAIGTVIAHELVHGFDDQGRKYDRFGNMIQWWNDAIIIRFVERAQCFDDQYSAYTIDGEHLNGKITLGENIADNGGIKAAYHAFLEIHKHEKTGHPLPGLPYDDQQLFFISYAQVWCSASTKEYIKHMILSDIHSVPKYRVNGALQNMKVFSEVFKCPVGSNMNPKDKCEVW